MIRKHRYIASQKYLKLLFFIFLAFILLFIFVMDDYSFLNMYKARRRIKVIDREINIIKRQNNQLKKENYLLKNNAETWEEKAREKNMKRKNEKIIKFKDN